MFFLTAVKPGYNIFLEWIKILFYHIFYITKFFVTVKIYKDLYLIFHSPFKNNKERSF